MTHTSSGCIKYRFAAEQGARVMLSEFAPIPGTPDGEACRAHTSLDEPLNHNKTAFTGRFLGTARVDGLKALCREVNRLRGCVVKRCSTAPTIKYQPCS